MKDGLVSVRDLMTTQLVTLDADSTVAEALALMAQNSVHELPLMSGANLKGWISYRSLLRRGGTQPQAKATTVMEQPPRLPKDMSVVDAADLLIRSNVRAAPVVDGKGKVVGLLSRTDILRATIDIPAVATASVGQAMITELETISETETVDKALARMRDLHIGQLLVLDRNGRLAGYVGSEDLLRAHSQEHAPSSSNHGRGGKFHGAGERPMGSVDVKGFVHDAPTIAANKTLGDAAKTMIKRGVNFVAIEEDGYAVGVLSRSNIVERVAHMKPPEGVPCQVIGLHDHADGSQIEAIYDLAQRTLKKVGSEVNVGFLNLHYKVYKAKNEGSEKFAVNAHLGTDGKFFVQKADAWDPMKATKAALDLLEKRVLNVKEVRLEKRKGPARRKAAFYSATSAD